MRVPEFWKRGALSKARHCLRDVREIQGELACFPKEWRRTGAYQRRELGVAVLLFQAEFWLAVSGADAAEIEAQRHPDARV